MKVVTGEQMKEIDRRAQEAGVSVSELMENAGRAVFEEAKAILGSPAGRRVVIICGKGNNGGDGLVAARYLKNRGAQVEVLLAAEAKELPGEPRANFESAVKIDVSVQERADGERVLASCQEADLVIDALLGTGVRGAVQGVAAEIIKAINRAGRPTLAVDIPSGVNADTGEICGAAVRAASTVTMGLPKWGLLNFPGAEYVGRLTIADIGFPPQAIAGITPLAESLDHKEAAALLPRRSRAAHKGDCGRILVIAGSVGYTGAAALSSLAALRIGAGLVTLAIPASLNDVMEVKLTEIITRPMPETAARSLSQAALEPILELAAKNDVVAMGPGLSLHPETVRLVRELVGRLPLPMVLDADALTALSEDLSPLKGPHAPVVLTPHPGEMARLLNSSPAEVQKQRVSACREVARTARGVVVLKGAATLIADEEGRLRINRTGNPGLASGGTGDVLTGMIAGLLGQGLSPFDAAGVGVYLHGLAGDLAAAEKGEMGLIASDLLEKIPAATEQVLGRAGRKIQS